MKSFVPNYYDKFCCIADKCKHSCCIGWEIDIDKESLQYYKNISSEFGKRLKENISVGSEPHFVLGSNDRCPFLNSCNLCDIYIELGKEHLCQICSDHPRFRNFFETRTELGLGMCCEAAAWLMLNYKDKMRLIMTEDDKSEKCDEDVFFAMRQKAFDILQDRSANIDKRIDNLKNEYDIRNFERTLSEWVPFYLTLENLDPKWGELLNMAKSKGKVKSASFDEENLQIAFEQLIVYFVYRHTADAVFENNFGVRLAFAILSFEMTRYLWSCTGDISSENLAEMARMYSQEIEYSEENMDELIFELENELFD